MKAIFRFPFRILFPTLVLSAFVSCGKDEFDEKITPYFFDRDCQVTSPDVLAGFSEGCYVSLLVDDFSDNANEWNLQTKSEYTHDISSGHLVLSTREDQPSTWGTSKAIPGFSQRDNWEYSVLFRIVTVSNGSESNNNLLLWGSDDDLKNYQAFSFNADKEFKVYQVTPAGSTSHHLGLLTGASFVSTTYYRFTVRTFQGTTYFFLNNTLFHQMPQTTLYGDRIFLGAGPGNLVWVDEVGVWGM